GTRRKSLARPGDLPARHDALAPAPARSRSLLGHVRLAAALGLFCALPAFAAVDCAQPKTAVETIVCKRPIYRTAELEIARLFTVLSEKAAPAERGKLEQDERAWVEARESSCGGVRSPRASCIAAAQLNRLLVLRGLERNGAPLPPGLIDYAALVRDRSQA